MRKAAKVAFMSFSTSNLGPKAVVFLPGLFLDGKPFFPSADFWPYTSAVEVSFLSEVGRSAGDVLVLKRRVAKLADAPDLGIPNRHFQNITFHFKKKRFYETEMRVFRKIASNTKGE